MEGDKPPIFKTWNQLYALVLGCHVVIILLTLWISKYFS